MALNLGNVNVQVALDTARAIAQSRVTGIAIARGLSRGLRRGDGQLTAFQRRLRRISAGIALLGQDIVVGLGGAIGAVTGLITTLGQALIQLGVVGVAGFTATAGAVGTLAFVLSGLGGQISDIATTIGQVRAEGGEIARTNTEIADSLEGLGENTAEAAFQLGRLLQDFRDLRDVLRENLFAGFGESLEELRQDGFFLEFAEGLTAVVDAIQTGIQPFFETLGRLDLADIFGKIAEFSGVIARTLAPAGEAFALFLQAALPFATEIAEKIQGFVSGIVDRLNSSEGMGDLIASLETGRDILGEWVEFAGQVFSFISRTASAAQEVGETFLGQLGGFFEGIDSSELEGFFAVVNDILIGLEPLFQGLIEAFNILFTRENAAQLADLAAALGELVVPIAELLDVVADAGILEFIVSLLADLLDSVDPGQLQELADAISGFFDAISTALTDSGAFETFGEVIGIIAEFLADVVNELAATGALDTLAEALVDIAEAVGIFVRELAEGDGIESIARAFVAMADAIIVLTPLLVPLFEFLGRIDAAKLEAIAIAFELLAGSLRLTFQVLAAAPGAVLDAWEDIQEAASGLAEFLTTTFGALVDGILAIWDRLGPIADFFEALVEGIIGFAQALYDVLFGGSIFPDLVNGILATWALLEPIVTFFAGLVDGIIALAEELAELLGPIIQGVVDGVLLIWEGLQEVVDFFEGIWDEVVGFAEGVADLIGGALEGVTEAIIAPFRAAIGPIIGIVNRIQGLWRSITGRNVGGNIDPDLVVNRSQFTGGLPGDLNSTGGSVTNNFVVNEVGDAQATASAIINRIGVST